MNGHTYMSYNGKRVEMYTSYMSTWKESWGEFVGSLGTAAQLINRIGEEQEFDNYQQYADYCYAKAERAAARYERIRTEVVKHDHISLRALVETMNTVANFEAAGDFFSNEAATDRMEAGLMDLHETPYTTGYYGNN